MKIGIDLGGTTMSAGLLDDKNRICFAHSADTNSREGPLSVIARMNGLIRQLLEENTAHTPEISHIGIGCPGTLDRKSGVVLYSNNIEWDHVELRKLIQKEHPVPVFMENDANCAALGEYVAGAGRHCSSMVMVTFGTGIGGGIVINRTLYRGSQGNAGIVGHMVIRSGGESCNCGRRGCWEGYASVSALVREAGRMADARADSALSRIRRRDGALNGRNIFEALRSGDGDARKLFERYVFYIAEGLTNLTNILDPQVIVIGGGISREGDFLLDPIRRLVRKGVYGESAAALAIVPAELHNDAGVIGAACLDQF